MATKEAPSWFCCNDCLWWAQKQSGLEKDCMRSSTSSIKLQVSKSWRCERWACRRCLRDWYPDIIGPQFVDHDSCKLAEEG
jgi:hypothetical protein